MSTHVSEYFADELFEWNQILVFYLDEIELLDQKISTVFRRNTMTSLAGKAGEHQAQLHICEERFISLQQTIHQQESILKPLLQNESADTTIHEDTFNSQAVLRLNVKAAEKEYIEIKFDCYQFLSSQFNKHSQTK